MAKIVAGGALFCSIKTKRFLFLRRTKLNKESWGIVGGKIENGEPVWVGVKREMVEEIGEVPDIVKTIPLDTYHSKDDEFSFHTFVCLVRNEFIPSLNEEHSGYAWTELSGIPSPVHPGLKSSIKNKQNLAKIDVIMELVDII